MCAFTAPAARTMALQKTTVRWTHAILVPVHPVGTRASIPTEIGNASPDPRVKPSRTFVHPQEITLTAHADVLRPRVPANDSTLVPVDPR